MELERVNIANSSNEQCRLDPPNITLPSLEQTNTNDNKRRAKKLDTTSKQKNKSNSRIEGKKIRYFVGTLCMLLAMTAGILIVYFTAPRPRLACEPTFKRTWKSSIRYSSQPRSVTSGDLNNDHHIDLVVANSGTNTIGIFTGQGNGTFGKQQTYSTGSESHPCSTVINDFNNDSYADIVVANYNINSIGLFLGYGNGTFDDQKLISLGSSHPLFVSAADFNKDNRIDIAVVNNGTNTISILFGYGNGSFQNPISYFTGYDSLPCSLTIGDFNNDTHLDIAVANSGTDNIGIFLNYGNGTFTNQLTYTTTFNSNPSSITLGDFNNDDILDIAVANYGRGTVGIFFGYGNGTFLPQVPYIVGSKAHPQYITVSHVDNANALSIVIVDSDNNQIHILPGYGNGSFATIATYDGVSESMPVWITVNDFNNNSQTDIVVVNYGINNVLVLMDYFAEPSTRQINYHGGEPSMLCGIAAGDFNGDRIIDIVFNGENYISTLIGRGDGTFDKHETYMIGDQSSPQYVGASDLNNDNKIDIFVVDVGVDGIDVFLGYGNGSFGGTTTYSTGEGSMPWWATVGDFNDDNVSDMVSANYGTYSIGILVGNGDGSFILTGIYSISGRPYSVAVGDINNDHHLDIVVSTRAGQVVIYLGQGDSIFNIMVTYVTGFDFSSVSVSLSNFNGDNYLDIVVSNTLKDNVGVLLGYGNGTFAPQTSYFTGPGSQPYYVIVADCNNDNISDLITTNYGDNKVTIFYGYGNGSFQISRNYSTGSSSKPFGIVTADLDNDTHLEFIVALSGPGDIAILTEYNAAEFVNNTVYSTGLAPQPTSVALADFNNDNQSDIVVANSGTDSLSILFASNNGTFGMEMVYPIGTYSSPQYVITYDINQDNYTDIVSVNSNNNSISLIMGYGNGSFGKQIIYPTGDNSYPSGVVVGDVNNDNRLDLVIANKGTDTIGILYGYDYTSFQPPQTYSSIDNLSPQGIIVSDFNNDNILDIAATFYTSNTWCILFGHGNGTFTSEKIYSLPKGSSPRGIGVGDFNNDNHSDIVIANYNADNIGVFLGYGNGNFTTVMLHSTGNGSKPIAVACSDFNNDSRLDIVVANYDGNSIGVFLGYGNGSFAIIVTYSTGQNSISYAVAVADLNNDGRSDITVANYGLGNVGVLFGYGNGTFAKQITFSSGSNTGPMWISIGDFNQDHQLDIATANYYGDNVGILLGYGNGSFASADTYSLGDGALPQTIDIGDFNNDNILDIAAANLGTNSIAVLFGFGDGSFLLGSAYSTGTASLPWALAKGDFNKDGQLDIAVTNQKLNRVSIFLGNDDLQPFASVTKYRISTGSQPHSLALGYFNNDSWIDIVIANYGTDGIGIILGRPRANFTDMRSYSTGEDSEPYSVAVAYVNSDTYPDIVVSNSKIDNIVIFFGDGSGVFLNRETYSTGTRSRPYTVVISDFNSDYISDIAVANSGTNNILLLYGYGNGTFGNQTSYPFDYGYEPYSITAGDLNHDNWVDLVIACYSTDHIETLIQKC